MNSLVGKQVSSAEQLHRWLHSFGMDQYVNNFLYHGYDLHTVSCTDPSDLIAIGIHQPAHRNIISTHVDVLKKKSPPSPMINKLPHSVNNWLVNINLQEYSATFEKHRINSVEKLIKTTRDDLLKMRINKLGHQKKLILSINDLEQTSKKKNNTDLRKALGTFQEAPGLSMELQQALSRRQKIMEKNNAQSTQHTKNNTKATQHISSEHNISSEISSYKLNASNNKAEQQKREVFSTHQQSIVTNQRYSADIHLQQRSLGNLANASSSGFLKKETSSSNQRGPPPKPPKRTSSMTKKNPLQLKTGKDLIKQEDRSECSTGVKSKQSVKSSPVNTTTYHQSNITSSQCTSAMVSAPSTTIPSQLKPEVKKKPQVVKRSQPPLSAQGRPPSNEVKTDVTMATTSKEPLTSEPNRALACNAADDFDWPAPPPDIFYNDSADLFISKLQSPSKANKIYSEETSQVIKSKNNDESKEEIKLNVVVSTGEDDNTKTQQILDDIGLMFDDLVEEFDVILS